jgi:acyl dehydratase
VDIERISALRFPPVRHAYDWRDAALYALSLGYGDDPTNLAALRFVTEADQQAVPSQCVVLGYPGAWLTDPALGVDYGKLLHGEQSFTIHRPLQAAARVVANHRVLAIEDKGPGKAAVLHFEKTVSNEDSGELLTTSVSALVLRGQGGCGAFGDPPPRLPAMLDESGLTASIEIATLPQSALLYRLNGDLNPLHWNPAIAARAGFDRPILHGLCTLGLACRAALRLFCDDDAPRLRSMALRFVAPVLPGETVRFDFFGAGSSLRFRASIAERNVIVLDNGMAEIA